MFYFTALISQTLLWFFLQPYLRYFAHFKVEGRENLKKISRNMQKRGVIFASNHSSVFDTAMIAETAPLFSRFSPFFVASRDKAFYGKKGLKSFFFGGLGSSLLGAVPLKVGTNNYDEALSGQLQTLSRGRSLCFFPEGGINRTGGPIKPKAGIGYLLFASNSVLVPVTIKGAYGIGFVGGVTGRKRYITIILGEPISREDIFGSNMSPSVEDFKIASQKIMDKINEKQDSFEYKEEQ